MFKKIIVSSFVLCILIPVGSIGQTPTQNIVDTLQSDTIRLVDDPMIARLDSMLKWTYKDHFCFTTDTATLNFCNFEAGECPTYTPEIIEKRMNFIDAMTPMDLDYNHVVQQYINMYTRRSKGTSSRMLGMSHKFFPIFDEMLDKYNLPIELKYLAIIESALNPAAKSPAGAAGLWQFMIGTGKEYGLEINSYIDERLDAYKSTDAACRYLKYLHGLYDDWNLALAAYNSGPGNVNKAIRRAGGVKNFWAIREHLPRETSGYVPAFIAINYVMNYASEHNIYPVEPDFSYFDLDTLSISKELRFDQIAAFTDLTEEEIAHYNPCYTKGVIPANGTRNNLYLTVSAVGDFIANESKVYEYKKENKPVYKPKEVYTQSKGGKGDKQITYKVKSGDVLGVIAENHDVGVSQLRSWNGIKGNRIYPGQRLKIWVDEDYGQTAKIQKDKIPKIQPTDDGKYQYHTVKSGDTLWDIAKLYDGVDYYELKKLNSDINIRRLKLGQKIKIKKLG